MGRSLSLNSVDAQAFQLLAGEQINENDLVQMGPDGKGYRGQGTNTAVVSNCTYGTAQTNAATGMIVAQTQVVSTYTSAQYRQALLRGDDGSIYTFTAQNSSVPSAGLMLSKYSAAGELLAKVDIETSSTYYSNQIFLLSNGNICVFTVSSGAYAISFAIYTPELLTVKSRTPVANAVSQHQSVCALAEGGFAVVFQPSATPLLSQLTTYDNAGNVVLPATTIWTRTGTSGAQYHQMAQLSDGRLVVTVGSTNTVSNVGLFNGIVSSSGASVLPFTNVDTSTQGNIHCLSVMDGYYAVSASCGAKQKTFVFTNAGVLRGAPFESDVSSSNNQQKLLNDGTNFYLLWPRISDTKEVMTKIQTTGSGYVTTDVNLIGNSQYNSYIDAFCEHGRIVCVSQPLSSSNLAPVLWVIDLSTGKLLNKSGTSFGVVPGTSSGISHRVISGGDFSFICLYDYTNTASTNLYIGKYANTSIMGVAKTSGAAGQLVDIIGASGGHAINKLAGPASVAFDHSGAAPIGNKGTLMNYGVTLKGI